MRLSGSTHICLHSHVPVRRAVHAYSAAAGAELLVGHHGYVPAQVSDGLIHITQLFDYSACLNTVLTVRQCNAYTMLVLLVD
jgi:hypothetical protein